MIFFWTYTDFNRIITLLEQNQALLQKLLKQEKSVMSVLDDLTAQVKANTDLEQSAVLLIQGIAAQLQVAIDNNDSTALAQLSQQLAASAASLGSAITANTPAAP